MSSEHHKPVIFLAFANDRVNYLSGVPREVAAIKSILEQKSESRYHVEVPIYLSVEELLTTLREYRNRIAILHFAGHSDDEWLRLENSTAHAEGLRDFLKTQNSIKLVFLNGCHNEAQATAYLEENVSAVIATSRVVEDGIATTFAEAFYRSLVSQGGNTNFSQAYEEAKAAVKVPTGGSYRELRIKTSHNAGWAWGLVTKDEEAGAWCLKDILDDPLFGLPPVPAGDLPSKPFRHLEWFDREHAAIFFGRDYEIRDLYDRVTAADGAPVILLYGQSGVGKSSLLAAGLMPRLETTQEVRYARRDQNIGLLGTLKRTIEVEGEIPLTRAWHNLEANLSRPVVIILDQLEERFTRPNKDQFEELQDFLTELAEVFSERDKRPLGKLILGFRKEWLAEIEQQIVESNLPHGKVFLEPLNRRGIIEAITGPTKAKRLREKYGLTIEEKRHGELAENIADDLLKDYDSPVVPTLQILLTKMWDEATRKNLSNPHFNLALYHELEEGGILLGDFLDQQLQAIREWQAEVVDLGLILDVLAFHTTPLGTAEQRGAAKLKEEYRHYDDLPRLVQKTKELYLLTDASGDSRDGVTDTRLTHDTLAPLVRQRFDESDKPGQRARHILENRAVEWKNDQKGTLLDEQDLAIVEQGAAGMRTWRSEEQTLIEASQKMRAKNHRGRRILWSAGVIAIFLVLTSAGFAWWQRDLANLQTDIATSRLLLNQGLELFEDEPLLGLRLALEGLALVPSRETILEQSFVASVFNMAKQGRLAISKNNVNSIHFGDEESNILINYFTAPPEIVSHTDFSLVERLPGVLDEIVIPDWDEIQADEAFVIEYVGIPGEVRSWKDFSLLASLSKNVSDVEYTPERAFMLIEFDDDTVELRRSIDGSLVSFDKEVSDFVFSEDFGPFPSFFAVNYKDGSSELRSIPENSVIESFRDRTIGNILSTISSSADPLVKVTFILNNFFDVRELWKAADGTFVSELDDTIAAPAGNVADAFFYYVGNHYIIRYPDAPGEIRQTSNAKLIAKLPDIVFDVQFPPHSDANYFIISYKDLGNPSELRRNDDGSLITKLSGRLDEVYFGKEPYEEQSLFRYYHARAEMRRTVDGAFVDFVNFVGAGVYTDSSDKIIVTNYNFFGETELLTIFNSSLVKTFNELNLDSSFLNIHWPPGSEATSFVITYEYEESPQAELRSVADGTLITTFTLAENFYNIEFSPDPESRSFVVWDDFVPELRSTIDGSLIATLPERSDSVEFTSDPRSSFLVVYDEDFNIIEMLLTSDGLSIPLPSVSNVHTLFWPNTTDDEESAALYLLLVYEDRSEIWSKSGLVIQLDLLATDAYIIGKHGEQVVIVQSVGNRVSLIDLDLLGKLNVDPSSYTGRELRTILCDSLSDSLIKELDEEALADYLKGRQPQACQI